MIKNLKRYHPERYPESRPVIRKLEGMDSMQVKDGIASFRQFEAMQEIMARQYSRDISAVPVILRPHSGAIFTEDLSRAAHYLAWVGCGRNIFHFGKGLTEAFRRTNIDGITLGEIKSPYPVVYLSFGKQVDLIPFPLREKFIDGAYVTVRQGSLQIMLTTVSDFYHGPWFEAFDPHYYLSVDLLNPEREILEAFESALGDEMESAPAAARVFTNHCAAIGIASRAELSASERITEYTQGFPCFLEALKLVINALIYLSNYGDDIDRQPPKAPRHLLAKQEKARTDKQKRDAAAALSGYSKIYLCGHRFEAEQGIDAGEPGPCKATHWRRGHWRQQPHGPGREQRRRVWIMPVLINPGTDQVRGHIYKVDSGEKS